MNIIYRNMERLIACSSDSDRERIEPMSAWKWRKLYQIANQYGIVPWIAAGVRAYEGDFFLQMPEDVKAQLANEYGKKSEENLEKFWLHIERSKGLFYQLSSKSIRAYTKDLIHTITNIEE